MLSRIRWCPWLGVLLVSMALLKPCSGADCDSGSAAADNNVITLVLFPRARIFFTLPRVQQIEIVVANESIDLTKTTECLTTSRTSCIINTASIADESKQYFFFDNVTDKFVHHILTLTIDDTIEVWCRNYTLHEYTEGQTFNFTCEPVFTGTSAPKSDQYSIIWRHFYNVNDLTAFKTARTGFEENLVNSSTRGVTVMNSGCITGATLLIGNASRTAVGYYIPSVVFVNDTMEMPVNETLLYYPTTVTNANEYEFSIFVTFGTGSARNVAIYCRVDTFPPPTISWSLKDRSDSSGTVISRVNNTHIRFGAVESVESSSNVGPNISYEMALTIDDALYSDAGIYHCIADNEVINTETDIVRLRVKDPLRPLWPALGTIGVFIVVILFIVIGTLCEKLWENVNENQDKTGGHHKRLFSVTSATEPENLNSDSTPQRVLFSDPTHMPVKRVPSSKIKLLEDSTTL